MRLFSQRKAAKRLCYQRSFNAFSFEEKGPKEKALQKENAVFALTPRGRPLLKKRGKTIAQSECELPDKSKFEIMDTKLRYIRKYKETPPEVQVGYSFCILDYRRLTCITFAICTVENTEMLIGEGSDATSFGGA